jgi:hypothetical protein
LAARPRGRDLLDQPAGLSPVVGARQLEVDDLDVDLRRLGGRDRLADGLEDPARLVANVGGVGPAVAPHDPEQSDQLLRPGEGAGRGEEPRRQAGGARREPFLEETAHRGQLVAGRGAILHPDRHQAQRVVADLHDRVHRGRREAIQVAGEARLLDLDPGGEAGQVLLEQPRAARQCRRHRQPAMADHLGGHALGHLALGSGRIGQREVRVRLDVDEPGRHHQAAGVDRAARRPGVARRDRGDPAVSDRDVAPDRVGAATIQHLTAADDQIVQVGLRPRSALHRRPVEGTTAARNPVGPPGICAS